MYDIRLDPRPGFLYISETGKVYGRITCKIMLDYFEYIPAPVADDITIVNNGTGGKDFEINLRAIGDEGIEAGNLREGTFLVYLFSAATGLDEAGVRIAIGIKVYNLTINTKKDNIVQKSAPGTINNSSEIDID